MAVNETTFKTMTVAKVAKTESAPSRAYVEGSSARATSMDVLKQFQANLATVEDLNGRLVFMMNEIRGLIRR